MSEKQASKKLVNHKEAFNIFKDCIQKGLDDTKIQEFLLKQFNYKWSIDSIRRNRRKLGVIKSGPNETITKDKSVLSTPPPGLDESTKADWFREQFKKSHLYTNLNLQFDSSEISMYIEEYGNICCQFEDIVFSEFFQIDDFLKHRILINRQLILMKSVQKEIHELRNWLENNPNKENETKEDKLLRVEKIRSLSDNNASINRINERYDKLVAERQKIASNLAATRRDRIDDLRNGKENFFSIIASLQTSTKEREKQGRYAEMTRIASEDIKTKLREKVQFPDGSFDSVIIDGESEVED